LPAIHLAEINFEAFYQQKMAAMSQQQQQPAGVPAAPANGSGAASA